MWIIISNNTIFTEMQARFKTIQFPHYVLSQAKLMRVKVNILTKNIGFITCTLVSQGHLLLQRCSHHKYFCHKDWKRSHQHFALSKSLPTRKLKECLWHNQSYKGEFLESVLIFTDCLWSFLYDICSFPLLTSYCKFNNCGCQNISQNPTNIDYSVSALLLSKLLLCDRVPFPVNCRRAIDIKPPYLRGEV